VADCSHCSKDGVCEACDNTNKVSPGGSSCVTACPENSSEQSSTCICSSGFAPSGDGCEASSSANLSTGAIAGISVTKSLSALCC
ncbi:Mr19,000 outer arm dynein light chain, partial [Giardia duodenalis]